jgi:peptide/nickel transport system permease protein
MIKYLIKRIFFAIITIFAVSIIIFSVIHMIPGDPVSALYGGELTQEEMEEVREYLGLNEPLPLQYIDWLRKILTFDLGTSLIRGDELSELIGAAFPNTIILAVTSLIIGLLIAFPIGTITALKRGTAADVFLSGGAVLFISFPTFWLAILLILVFAVMFGILPAGSYNISVEQFWSWNYWRLLIMPSLAIGIPVAGRLIKIIRIEMIDNMGKEYVQLVRTKGAGEGRVIVFHILRNAMVATSTIIGLTLAHLLGGVVIIENVFGYPGIGKLLLESVMRRDYPTIQIIVMIFSLSFILINLFVDIFYSVLDPRIRLE